MWYKNIAVRFFGLVTKHACDRQTDGRTDRITTPKTALAQLRRAVKIRLHFAANDVHYCLHNSAYCTLCFYFILDEKLFMDWGTRTPGPLSGDAHRRN